MLSVLDVVHFMGKCASMLWVKLTVLLKEHYSKFLGTLNDNITVCY